MAIDDTASKTASNALAAIPFSDIIGGPLNAAVQAQAQSAKTSWDFIKEVGLNTDKDGNQVAVQVDFSYVRDGRVAKLTVPLLTIIPIPYIQINSVAIDFKASISASASSRTEETKSETSSVDSNSRARAGWGSWGARTDFKANYSSKKDSSATEESQYSVEYTLDVSVRAGQSDMPAGMATVLNILQDSISSDESSGLIAFRGLSDVHYLSDFEGGRTIFVMVKDSNGMVPPDSTEFLLTLQNKKVLEINNASKGSNTQTVLKLKNGVGTVKIKKVDSATITKDDLLQISLVSKDGVLSGTDSFLLIPEDPAEGENKLTSDKNSISATTIGETGGAAITLTLKLDGKAPDPSTNYKIELIKENGNNPTNIKIVADSDNIQFTKGTKQIHIKEGKTGTPVEANQSFRIKVLEGSKKVAITGVINITA